MDRKSSIYMSIQSLIKIWNNLSLDVALGVIISSSFLALILSVEINILILSVLTLIVWAIYTFDHLMDSRTGDMNHFTERHLFHRIHFNILSKFLIADLLIVFMLLFFLPSRTILIGSGLGILVLIYFLSIRFLNWKTIYHKEFMIAVVYCSGLLILPFSSSNMTIQSGQLLMLFPMFFLVLGNLLLFALKDISFDNVSKFPSVIQVLGVRASSKIIDGIGIILIINIIFIGIYEDLHVALIYSIMFIMLTLIAKSNTNSFVKQNYRYLGDAIFMIPILYFFF